LRPFLYVTIEALTALAILVFLALTVMVIPGLFPSIGESEKLALPKADRLATRPIVDDCSQQTWPHLDRSCLRRDGSPGAVEGARLIKPQ
jgi:hypothetical protein